MEMTMDRMAFSVEEVAQILGVSESFVRLEMARGNLGFKRVGRGRGRLLVSTNDIDSYLRVASGIKRKEV